MTETIRFSLIGAQDVRFGTGTFEVVLADGRVVILEAINAGHISGSTTGSTANETVNATMLDVYRARRGLTGLFDFDQDDSTTTGLTWGYKNGMSADGTGAIAAGTVTLTANSTNYVEFDPETGVISVNTSAFSPTDKVPIRKLVTNASGITANTDVRPHWRQNVNLLHGQCYLSWVSTSEIKLLPLNGNRIIINGTTQTIGSSGVSLSNSGLSSSTTYHIYAYMNGSTMTLEASTTTHATSATDGIRIKTGDQTRTYVGSLETDGSSNFRDNIRQWFRTHRDNAVAGLLQTAKGADVASATAPAFLSDGNYFVVTGTTSITDLPLWQAGTVLILRFASTLTVTHNASKINLAGAANMVTTSGDRLVLVCDASGVWYEIARSQVTSQTGRPRSYLAGLTLSNNSGDATNDIDVAAGACRDKDDSVDITLASAITGKQLDAAWAVGSSAGMRATGVAIADTTYHIFAIMRPDTGVVDIAADTSATGANIAANTNAAYTKIRRIGSIVRTGGAIKAFTQTGDYFEWTTPVSDISATNAGTSAVTRTLTIPTDRVLEALVSMNITNGATANNIFCYLSPLTTTDEAASAARATAASGNTAAGNGAWRGRIKTNTSAQIRSRQDASDANSVLSISTLGWYDRRGRDD